MQQERGGYGQYCPISRALDVLGERWSLLIIRDLLVGATRFNDLARGLPRLSRSLLSKRLRQFEQAGIVERVGQQYFLTEAGQALEPIVFGLGAWGAQWAFGEPYPEELDAEVLVWWMHNRLDVSGFPGRRQVFHLRFTDEPRQFWIVVEHGDPSVCVADPGFEVDIAIVAQLAALYEVWLGHLTLAEALRAGTVELHGPAPLVRRMAAVLRLSPAAPLVRAVADRST